MRVQARIVMVGALLLAGCDKPTAEVACTSQDAQDVISRIVTDEIVKRTDVGDADVGQSAIRAAVNKLKVSVIDIRTTKEDPNSTKRFCEGTVKVVFPLSFIDEADRAREMLDYADVTRLLGDVGFERAADTFSRQMTFAVQPTDDGKKVFGEVENFDTPLSALGEVVASQVLLPRIQGVKDEEALAAKQQEELAAQQAKADLDLAASENKLATQTINEVWQALPDGSRAELLEVQRAWIGKKAAECNIRAAGASTDATQKEIARLKCDTELTSARTAQLRTILY